MSRVVWSQAAEGTLYATLDGHRSNDFKPYVVKSTDYGNDVDVDRRRISRTAARCRSSANIRGNRICSSSEPSSARTSPIDGGAHWTQLKSGIPGVPVHDLQIQTRANDLVAGTHGRGIYILDDLTPLEHLAKAKQASVAYLFPVQDALLFQPNGSRSSGMGTRGFSGQNPEPGPHIAYSLGEVPREREGLAHRARRERRRRCARCP